MAKKEFEPSAWSGWRSAGGSLGTVFALRAKRRDLFPHLFTRSGKPIRRERFNPAVYLLLFIALSPMLGLFYYADYYLRPSSSPDKSRYSLGPAVNYLSTIPSGVDAEATIERRQGVTAVAVFSADRSAPPMVATPEPTELARRVVVTPQNPRVWDDVLRQDVSHNENQANFLEYPDYRLNYNRLIAYGHVWVFGYQPDINPDHCASWQDGDCLSNMSNGEDWRSAWGAAAACPAEWPLGSTIELGNYETGQTVAVYECMDRGSSVRCDTSNRCTIAVLEHEFTDALYQVRVFVP